MTLHFDVFVLREVEAHDGVFNYLTILISSFGIDYISNYVLFDWLLVLPSLCLLASVVRERHFNMYLIYIHIKIATLLFSRTYPLIGVSIYNGEYYTSTNARIESPSLFNTEAVYHCYTITIAQSNSRQSK